MDTTEWLLASDEPWTRYRVLVDLLGFGEQEPQVQNACAAVQDHPQVRTLLDEAAAWPGYTLQRHNDSKHTLYKISTLADFGLHVSAEVVSQIIAALLEHQSPEGAFQTTILVPRAFGGSGDAAWTWMACDAPTILYALLAFGLGNDQRVQCAVEHLAGLVADNGWRCVVAPELGKFKGPGRRTDPCPIANVYALKALSLVPALADCAAVHNGVEALLNHWAHRKEQKYFLFGMGSDFQKLKYPFIWYDILHVTDVLSRFPFARTDSRFLEMLDHLTAQADDQGRYTAGSMYTAWKGWSFADKKKPSPWLTFLVKRIQQRVSEDSHTPPPA